MLDTFKNNHLRIRYKMLCAIDEKRRVDANEISPDNGCELGEWLQRQASKPGSQQTVIVELADSHTNFHQEAHKIANMINSGQYEEASRALGLCTPYSHWLLGLTSGLASLEEEGEPSARR